MAVMLVNFPFGKVSAVTSLDARNISRAGMFLLFRQISYRASLELVGDLIQLSPNHKAVCLENARHISSLPNQRDNDDASIADRNIHNVVFPRRPDAQSADSGQTVLLGERPIILRRVLCSDMKVSEILPG